MYGLNVPEHLDQAGLQTWLLQRPQQDATSGLPLGLGPGAATPAPAQIRSAIDRNIATFYADYTADELSGSNPADNEMVKIGLWLELDVGIAFLVGLGFGSLTGQRTTTTIVLIALEIIVTPLLARVADPLLHRRPAARSSASRWTSSARRRWRPARRGGGGPGQLLFGGRGALGIPPMPTWAMIAVIVGWIVGWSAIGAWRMMTRDA